MQKEEFFLKMMKKVFQPALGCTSTRKLVKIHINWNKWKCCSTHQMSSSSICRHIIVIIVIVVGTVDKVVTRMNRWVTTYKKMLKFIFFTQKNFENAKRTENLKILILWETYLAKYWNMKCHKMGQSPQPGAYFHPSTSMANILNVCKIKIKSWSKNTKE